MTKSKKSKNLDVENAGSANLDESYFISKLSLPAAVVLVCLLLFLFLFLSLAPRENLLIVSDFLKDIITIFIEGFFEIVVLKGLGGAFYELKSSVDLAISTVYADFAVQKLVVFVTVAVVVRYIPWIADTVVELAMKPPK